MLSMLIFSKDRPLQLDGLLRSIYKHYTSRPKVTVLYKFNSEFEQAYNFLIEKYDQIVFIQETNFERQVRDWLDQIDTEYFCFSCDDVLINRKVDLGLINSTFIDNQAIFSFSIRLGSCINYCQPSKQQMDFDRGDEDINVFDPSTFPHNWDFGYPFEVTGTIYRTSNFRNFLLTLPEGILRHPNIMEGPISAHLHAIPGLYMACFKEPCSLTITVNRVQEISKNEIFEEVSTEKLLELWDEGKRLDIDYYEGYKHNAICIGELKLI